MTDIQPRNESAGEGSDDEPLKNLVKPGRKRFPKKETDASLEETSKENVSTAEESPGHCSDDEPLSKPKKSVSKLSDAESPGHNSDDEPLSKLAKPKKSVSKRSDAAGKEPSDSEDDEPLKTMIKQRKGKKQKPDKGEPVTPDAKKVRSPKKRKMEEKASLLRDSSPSPVKVTQKRGKIALSTDTLLTTSMPQMKKAVVLLKRLSEQDIKKIINRRHKQEKRSTVKTADLGSESAENSSDEEPLNLKLKRLKEQRKPGRGSKAAADASSDDEPLVRKVKTVKTKDKRRKTANQEEDTAKQEKEQPEEDERSD